VDPDTLFGLAGLLAFVFVLLGCWTIHRRARSRASLLLVWSVAAFIAWFPISSFVQYAVLVQFESSTFKSTLNWILLSSETFIPALLLVAASVSFWRATRAIESRPN
jgi:hypothetical protein